MTLEDAIIKPLIDSGVLKFYSRFVDDTLLLAKPSDFPFILNKLNSFHPQLQFTIDSFTDDQDIHFLDIKITPNGTSVYANLLIQDNTYTYLVLHLGLEELLGYVHLFIVLINTAVTVKFCLSNFLKFPSSLLGMVSLNVLLRTVSNTSLTCSPITFLILTNQTTYRRFGFRYHLLVNEELLYHPMEYHHHHHHQCLP